jgi:hypothetical protein
MRISLFVFLCLASAIAASLAYAMPRYNVEAWCEEVAGASGDYSSVIYNGCIEQEQSSYDQLKDDWSLLPSRVRSWCDQVAKASGHGSYLILDGCVRQEMDASQSKPAFKY